MEIIAIVLIVFIGVFGNILIYKLIVRSALKNHIEPYVSKWGYTVDKVQFPGLLSTGDFPQEKFSFRPMMPKGNPARTTYVYLYLNKNSGKNKIRITARIKTLFFFIRKVEYSSNDLFTL